VHPILLGLAGLSLLALIIQTWKSGRRVEERIYALFALLVCFVALPGGAVVGLAATDSSANVAAIALAWLTCSTAIIELSTWGRPVLLPRWLDMYLERRTLLPFGHEKQELARVKRKLRPYSKFFRRWLMLLPIAWIAAMTIGY
jgi:hypothetical protein